MPRKRSNISYISARAKQTRLRRMAESQSEREQRLASQRARYGSRYQNNKNSAEIKVFCPKCNTEVSHTAEGIQEDQTKIIIAKVYHYFEQELDELKKYEDIDLTLAKFRLRTALATGVTETKVLQILEEEKERNANKRKEAQQETRQKLPQKQRIARKRPRQSDSEEPEIYVEPAAVTEELSEGEANKVLADPIAVEVKTEHRDDEEDASSLLGENEVKVELIEISEEGFS